jgi:type VI protein secretion system component VasF
VIIHAALLGSLDLALGEYAAAAAGLKSLLPRLHVLGVRPLTQAIWTDTVEALEAADEPAAAAEVAAALERSVKEPVSAALAARCLGHRSGRRGPGPSSTGSAGAGLALRS